MKFGSQIFGMLFVAVLLIALAVVHPAYLSSATYLGGLLLVEVILAAVWHYEKWFFPILMLTFLLAGSDLPLAGAASTVRWIFLIVGGFVGIVKWSARSEKQKFSLIHLVAMLCVVSALVSAMVSSRVQVSLLKSSSLLFLFVYASCGARVAVADRTGAFFRRLVTAMEVLAFASGLSYIVLRFAIFGNPNSLGAIMGVAVIPILSWGVLISEDRQIRSRRAVALCVAGYLLASSLSRAGLLAAGVTLTVMCWALHRGVWLVKGLIVLAFLVTAVGVVQPTKFDSLVSSFTEDVIYKGKVEKGLLGSRKSPWQNTVAVIKESPWFGSGFGTDNLPARMVQDSAFRTYDASGLEHGSSYMALLQYVGLLGVVPFAILLMLIVSQIFRTCMWMRRTCDPRSYAVPLALVCLAGLLHATFEDWLIAPGYYLTLFFWISAFLLSDFLPVATSEVTLTGSLMHSNVASDSPVAVFAGK
jgi:hypothetical protein